MSQNRDAAERTMNALAEAVLHFDPSVSNGPVPYSESPVVRMTAVECWRLRVSRMAWSMTDQGVNSRYGSPPQFDVSWLDDISDEEHAGVEDFIRTHRYSFWAIDGLFDALLHQIMNNSSSYRYLLRNFILLWDSSNARAMGREDCYSLCSIKGVSGVDIGSLTADEQHRYAALVGFNTAAHIEGFMGYKDNPAVLHEETIPMRITVLEPYRSMVWEYPQHNQFVIDYLKRGYRAGDEILIAELLPDIAATALNEGVL